MRAVILLLLTAASISAATAQQITSRPPNRNQTAAEFVRRDRLHLPGHFGTRRDPDSGVRVNVRTFTSPQLLNEFIRLNQSQLSAAPVPPNPTGHLPPPNPTAHPTSLVRPTTRVAAKSRSTGSRTLGATCANHAFFELIGLTNSVVYAGAMTHTRDDGVVISGSIYDSTAAEPSWQINAYILKCDNLGNILWVNLLVDPNNDPSYDFEPLTLKEMPAGDLVLAAMVSDDPTGNNSEVTSIYHLTAAGATLKPSLAFAGTYLWQDGSTQNFMLIQDTGTYRLTTSNTCGTSKGAIHVTAGLCTLVMPNAFTPNGDGRNDVFRVRYPFSVTHFVMAIYDRWGQQVFHSTNIDEGWDGTIHGSPAPTGTYVWFISLTDWQNKNQFQKGTVMLVR